MLTGVYHRYASLPLFKGESQTFSTGSTAGITRTKSRQAFGIWCMPLFGAVHRLHLNFGSAARRRYLALFLEIMSIAFSKARLNSLGRFIIKK